MQEVSKTEYDQGPDPKDQNERQEIPCRKRLRPDGGNLLLVWSKVKNEVRGGE